MLFIFRVVWKKLIILEVTLKSCRSITGYKLSQKPFDNMYILLKKIKDQTVSY